MTVSSDLNRITYAGNGTTTVFAVNYYFLEDSHLQVVLISATGVETVQTLTTNYTVSGAGNEAGGSITMLVAPPTGTTLVIQRNVPATQETDYLANDPFPAESHERALDKLTMLVQQNERDIDRALKIPLSAVGSTSTDLPIPVGNKLLAWNSDASAVTNFDPSDVITIVGQQTSYGDVFTGNGSTTNFSLTRSPGSVFGLDVSINGVTQVPNVDYILSGTTLSFTTAPPAAASKILARYAEVYQEVDADAQNVRYLPAGSGAQLTTVQAKLRETVSVKDFGAVGDGVTDDTAAIQAALDSGASLVEAPDTSYLVTSTLIVPNGVAFVGKGRTATTIVVGADVVGVELGSYSQLRGFKVDPSVTHTNNGVDAGTPSRGGGRTIIEDVWVNSAGNDGIQVRNGNLGTIRDVICTSNGRDGINFTTETADNNGWKLEGVIDLRGNTRDGLNFATGSSVSDANAPRTNSCDYVVAQQNGRYGVYCGTRNNNFVAYLEANTTKDLYLDTYANGCNVVLLEIAGYSSITNNSAGSQISIHSAQADYVREYVTKVTFSGRSGLGWQINNDDGTAGVLSATKKSANTYSFSQTTGAANALTWFEHASAKHTLGATGGFISSQTSLSIPTAAATTVASFGVLVTDAFFGVIKVMDSGGTTIGSTALVTNFTSGGTQVLSLASVTNGSTGSALTVSGGDVQFAHTYGSDRTFIITLTQFGQGKA